MNPTVGHLEKTVTEICEAEGKDRSRLLPIAKRVQEKLGCVSDDAIDRIAAELTLPRVEIDALVSFYAFLSKEKKGKVVIRLCDDIIDRLQGYDEVRAAFEETLGLSIGETTPDGQITLERTACIGMSDQAPAALVNDVVVPRLDADRAREIVSELREHLDPSALTRDAGSGRNSHPLIWSMVDNNLREEGEILFSPNRPGESIRKALAITPKEVIRTIKAARLRGRGGAGFPTGMKWEFTRAADGDRKFIICNADEGEPGTFKDRVLLTEKPDRVFAGMTIGGYAIGAAEGILYLRAEYTYLRRYLENVLSDRRRRNLLGENILGTDFDFDIEIRMGAGAYVCGEETALISSLEGYRGDPKNRPPFPAQRGYLGCPTSVNNVETLACVTKIMHPPVRLGRLPAARSLRGRVRDHAARLPREVRRGGRDRRPGRRAERPDGRTRGLRPDHLLRGPLDRRFDDGLRAGPGRPRDRPGVHGVLRGGELRLLHAVPRRKRAPEGGARPRARRAGGAGRPRAVRVDRRRDEGDEPLRARADVREPGPLHDEELPRGVRVPGAGGPGRIPEVVRPRGGGRRGGGHRRKTLEPCGRRRGGLGS
jgi:NADH:ubiquinone oxidoreductase subunit E